MAAGTAAMDTRDVVYSTQASNWRISIVRGASAAHQSIEADLAARGIMLPFGSQCATNTLPEYSPSLFLAVQDRAEVYAGGCALQLRPAPLIRGHQLVRLEQFGLSIPSAAVDAVISALRQWMQTQKQILRVSVDVFAFDAALRQQIGDSLGRSGFRRARHVNGYIETLVLDLQPPETDLFAGLHHSARRKIRQLDKNPIELRTIDDPALGERMNELLFQTFARTGGDIHARDWTARIELSRDHPDTSRIVGLFRTDVTGPDALLAFAWGCRSGDSVFYSEAASTRELGDQKIAVAYGVMWDLIKWAKRTGARIFDFGGITRGSYAGGEADPLGGISDFKRYFSQEIVEVRSEWILDDHTLRARLIGALHRRLRGG
jgi:hypothetical protein